MPKKSTQEILEKLMKGGVHLSTEAGSATPMKQKEALKLLRKEGIEAIPTGGSYKGMKEGSLFIPQPSEKAKKIIEDLAKKTGQESTLVTKPGSLMPEAALQYSDKTENIGKGFRITDKQPVGENWTKFSTKEGPKYIEYGTGEVPVQHYGKEGLKELDPKMQGTGTDEFKFRQGKPETQFQSAYGFGVTPEHTVLSRSGTQKYTGNINPEKMYDFSKDPQGFLAKAQKDLASGNVSGNPVDANDLARRYAKEAGFEGTSWKMNEKTPIYESFNKLPVVKGFAESKPSISPLGALGTAASAAGNVLEKLDAPRKWFLDKAFGKMAETFKQPKDAPEYEVAKTAADMIIPDVTGAGSKLSKIVEGSAKFKKGMGQAAAISEKLQNSPEALSAIKKLEQAGQAPSAEIAAAYNKATGKIIPVVSEAGKDTIDLLNKDKVKNIMRKLP